jgi:glutamate 5-kinase
VTVVIKLGSSIVAADDGELRADVLDSVCAQVSELERGGERVVMVTSGAIARGIRLMELAQRPKAMDELQAASAVGQGDLFRAYESRLAMGGTRAAQVLLTASDTSTRTHYLNARHTLLRLIEWGVVPVINENDTTATDEITFGDNDFLAAQVALLLRARLLILLTNTEGLFNMHPLAEEARMFKVIDDVGVLEEAEIDSEISPFGRGGMGSKVAAARMASESGIPVVICNGTQPETLRKAAAGEEVGTRFVPHPGKTPAFKLWLKYAKAPKGAVWVDAGATQRLLDGGASLLPVGVRKVEGSFEADDGILVRGEGGRVIGKGISEYPASALKEIIGLKSEQVRKRFPQGPDEVVHRDRFVLL